ncbi:MAG: pentapeptide repeat-containing protein [Planctomycetota bacterium]
MANPRHVEIVREGSAAIDAWRRDNPGHELDLTDANLDDLTLRAADLSGANLRGASLRNASLRDVCFVGAMLRGVDLTDLRPAQMNVQSAKLSVHGDRWDLAGADLRGADLSGLTLFRGDLSGSRLHGTNLAHTQWVEVGGLSAGQLGGTNVWGATLPAHTSSFDDQRKNTESSTKNARTLFLTLLGACIFSLLTMASTSDRALLLGDDHAKLPFVGVEAPIEVILWATPPLLLAVFIYFQMYLQRLWEQLAMLPSILPDGRAADEAVSPWLLSGVVRAYRPRFTVGGAMVPRFLRLQALLGWLMGWCCVPACLFYTFHRGITCGSWPLTIWHAMFFAASALGAQKFRQIARETWSDESWVPRRHWWTRLAFAAPYVCILLVVASLVPGLPTWAQALSRTTVNMRGEVFPTRKSQSGLVVGVDLKGRKLAGSDWSGAVLDGADLSGSSLIGSDFSGAFVESATLRDIDFAFGNWRSAHLTNSDLRRARGLAANLDGAHLSAADLSNAILVGATLSNSELMRATLAYAALDEADLSGANLSGANLASASLRSAKAEGADFSGVDFDGARLDEADLRGALGLEYEQLMKAHGWETSQLPPAIVQVLTHEQRVQYEEGR